MNEKDDQMKLVEEFVSYELNVRNKHYEFVLRLKKDLIYMFSVFNQISKKDWKIRGNWNQILNFLEIEVKRVTYSLRMALDKFFNFLNIE